LSQRAKAPLEGGHVRLVSTASRAGTGRDAAPFERPAMANSHAESAVKQLRLVTAFSRAALQDIPLDELLRRACEAVRDGVDAKFTKILEYRRDRDDFLLVAGVGLRQEEYGKTTIPGGERSPPGRVMATREPLRIDDFPNQSEYDWDESLRKYGIVSAHHVHIALDGQGYGVLQIDSTRPARWTDDEIDFLSSFANLLGAAIERKRLGDSRLNLLRERETLLLELQHRVKNHIQLVSALLGVQQRREREEGVRAALGVARRRIVAVASAYSNLYRTGATVDLREHLAGLTEGLQGGFDIEGLRIEVEVISYAASMDLVVPVSLITSELVTNAIKHAALGPNLPIAVSLKRCGERQLRLQVQDHGRLPADFTLETHAGLGLSITAQLARQIGGELRFEREPVTFYVLFPEPA
jgi:two-component sensor histidine kinase